MPADPEHREPLFHQEAVAPIGGVFRIERGSRGEIHGTAVHRCETEAAAAVRDIEETHAPALLGVDGLEHHEIGARLDQPVGVARREGDVADARVGLALGIEAEADLTFDQLVGPGCSECLSAEDRHAFRDLEVENDGGRRSGGAGDQGNREGDQEGSGEGE